MKYALSNDVRARSVAKDLTKIAKEMKVELPLTIAQKVVAKMMGYDSWQHLNSQIGLGNGPEDHELTVADAVVRKNAQSTALLEAGFPQGSVDRVLSLLRPTGRQEASIKTSPRVWPIQTGGDYHPNRFRDVLRRIADDPYHGWSGYADDLDELVQRWAKTRPLSALDREACTAGMVATLSMDVDSLLNLTGHVVDISAMLNDEPDDSTLLEGWSSATKDPDGLTAYYFHFGNHRFPSPFEGIGVDGCYINLFSAPGEELPDSVDFQFTTSVEFDRASEDVLHAYSAMQEMRSILRMVDVSFSPSEGETLQDALDDQGELSEKYIAAWQPYLATVLKAAWHSFKAYRAREMAPHDALFVDEAEVAFTRLERAKSDRAVVKVMTDMASELEEFPVRFVGKQPPSEDVFHELLLASPFPRADSGPKAPVLDDVRAKLADVLDVSNVHSSLSCAREALAMAGLVRNASPGKVKATIEAYAHIMNGAHMVGSNKEAISAAEAILAADLDEAIQYLPGVVIVAVRAGNPVMAQAALEKLSDFDPSAPTVVFSEVLTKVAFGDKEEEEQALVDIVTGSWSLFNELVAADEEPWGWFGAMDDKLEDEEAESNHAVCMFREPLREVGVMDKLRFIEKMANDPSAEHNLAAHAKTPTPFRH